MNIYVGNLAYRLSENELEEIFREYGEVASVKIIVDKFTGKSKGYGFIEMPNDEEGQAAIDELDGAEVGGRNIKVNTARPPKRY